MEVGYTYALREGFLVLETFIEAFSKVGLHTHGLQDEYAHANQTLLRGVVFLVNGVEEYENDKVMRSVRINDEGSEPLVAL
jgi:hypothetical protein